MTDSEFLASMHIEPSCSECPLHEAQIVLLRDALAHAERRAAGLRRTLDGLVWVLAGVVMSGMIWWIGRPE